MDNLKKVVLTVLLVPFVAITANAALIEIGLTAQITELYDTPEIFGGQIHVGDIITGSYKYDSDTPDSALSPTVGSYWFPDPSYSLVLNAGPFTFQSDPDMYFNIRIANNHSSLPYDSYVVDSRYNLPVSETVSVDSIYWRLHDNSATAHSSVALPTTPPVLEDFPDSEPLHIWGAAFDPDDRIGFSIHAPVTSVWLIPEPATIFLLAFGVPLIRRKKPGGQRRLRL